MVTLIGKKNPPMKKFLIYTIELIIAGVAIAIDMRLFWLYFFFTVMYMLDKKIDNIRKLVRVYQVFNETKIQAIARKLHVSEDDIQSIMDETKNNTPADKWESLEKDFKDII